MLESSDWRNFLKKLIKRIKWLNWRGKRAVFIRGYEIKEILEELSQYELGIKEDRDLAREEFRGAVQRYVLGFYDDCVYHSFFSVEIGLLIRINEILTDEEKRTLHKEINKKKKSLPFTFGAIKSKSEEKRIGILRGYAVKLANDLLKKRNTHIHGQNFISALINIQTRGPNYFLEKSPEIRGMMRSYERHGSLLQRLSVMILRQVFHRLLIQERKNRLISPTNLSSFEWCSKDELRTLVEEDVETYLDNVIPIMKDFSEDLAKFRIREPIGSLRKLYEYTRPDAYWKKRAYGILKESYSILKSIEII